MLERPQLDRRLLVRTLAGAVRGLLICALLLPPGFSGVTVAVAQAPPAENQNEPFSLAYVPRDAVAVVAGRPAALLKRPSLASLNQALQQQSDGSLMLGVQFEDVVETSLVVLLSDRGFSAAVTIRADSPKAAKQFIESLGANPRPAKHADTTYYRANRWFFFQPDPLSVIMAPDAPSLIRCIAAGPKGATTTNWAEKWTSVSNRDVAAVVNTSLLRAIPSMPLTDDLLEMVQGRNRMERPGFSTALQIAPLWQRSESIVAELQVSDDVDLILVSESVTDEEAQQVHGAMLTTVALGRLLISSGRQALASREEESTPVLLAQLDLVDEILEKAQIVRKGSRVGLVARADARTAKQLVEVATPAVLAAQRLGYRTGSMNNLKRLAIAFHNYHDTYKFFPSAVQIGPKDVPHSWRVTILPFIEGQALYDAYRLDEPWDSPNNRGVLAAMPAIFRSPLDAADSTNTSYFGLTGQGTVFEEDKPGRMASITDGTSNTIMLVESKLSVPWTKPVDIPFDPEGPLPAIGGWFEDGFSAAMCDGRSVFFAKDFDPNNLRNLIIRNDGKFVQLPDARR